MIVYCLIPVHNRLEMTQRCVDDLLAQDFDGSLEIVVIDDGSTDGTAEYLAEVSRKSSGKSRMVTVINGDGTWWWSKCMNTAITDARKRLSEDDAVLFLNDDVHVEPKYIRQLLRSWSVNGKSVVISQLVNADDHTDEIESPIRIDPDHLLVGAITHACKNRMYSPSDAAPGRGTLYPSKPFLDGMLVDELHLPHYLADYEFSVRVRQSGWSIICAHDAKVFTANDWGNARRRGGLRWRMFAKESPDRLVAYWQFWRTASPELAPLVLAWRMLRYRVAPQIFDVIPRRAHT